MKEIGSNWCKEKSPNFKESAQKLWELWRKTKGEKLRNPGPNWVKTQNMTFQASFQQTPPFLSEISD